jgi:hypothetical protein
LSAHPRHLAPAGCLGQSWGAPMMRFASQGQCE